MLYERSLTESWAGRDHLKFTLPALFLVLVTWYAFNYLTKSEKKEKTGQRYPEPPRIQSNDMVSTDETQAIPFFGVVARVYKQRIPGTKEDTEFAVVRSGNGESKTFPTSFLIKD